ncbi:MAG: hypothetical protein ABL962_05600 [Fimbriimonadaceae bacterium]
MAVWILAAFIAANTFVSLLSLFAPSLATRVLNAIPESSAFSPYAYNRFHDWPIEKQIQSASVIAIAKWQQTDDLLKCVISEIVKQAPNTTFHYKIGDEYRSGNQAIRDNTSYGDGQIMFFTGSSATFRFSTTYRNDRIRGMGDMPINELRAIIQKQK